MFVHWNNTKKRILNEKLNEEIEMLAWQLTENKLKCWTKKINKN